MRRFTRIAGLALGLVLASAAWLGCPAEQSERCRTLCRELVVCIEDIGNKSELVVDEHECTTTCTSLERDPEGKARVDQYAACVAQAGNCNERIDCNDDAGKTPR